MTLLTKSTKLTKLTKLRELSTKLWILWRRRKELTLPTKRTILRIPLSKLGNEMICRVLGDGIARSCC